MSIDNEINRIKNAKNDIKNAIESKGVAVPASEKIDNYSAYIAQLAGSTDIANLEKNGVMYRGALPNATNLDTYATIGYFTVNNTVWNSLTGTKPPATEGGTFINLSNGSSSTSAHAQIFITYSGLMFIRDRTSTAWGGWKRLATTGDIPSLSDYVKKTGDTMTGMLGIDDGSDYVSNFSKSSIAFIKKENGTAILNTSETAKGFRAINREGADPYKNSIYSEISVDGEQGEILIKSDSSNATDDIEAIYKADGINFTYNSKDSSGKDISSRTIINKAGFNAIQKSGALDNQASVVNGNLILANNAAGKTCSIRATTNTGVPNLTIETPTSSVEWLTDFVANYTATGFEYKYKWFGTDTSFGIDLSNGLPTTKMTQWGGEYQHAFPYKSGTIALTSDIFTDDNNVQIGDGALAVNSIAIGNGAIAGGGVSGTETWMSSNIAIGVSAKANQIMSTVVGYGAQATSTQSVVVGYNAKAESYNCTVLGQGATASVANTVVLGNSNITSLQCAVQSITTLSDERTKEDIILADTAQCLADIERVPVHRFKYKKFARPDPKDVHVTDFIAQEVAEVFPKSIHTYDEEFPVLDENGEPVMITELDENGNVVYKQIGEDKEGNPIYADEPNLVEKKFTIENVMHMDKNFAVPTMWAAIQELSKQVKELKEELRLIKNNG